MDVRANLCAPRLISRGPGANSKVNTPMPPRGLEPEPLGTQSQSFTLSELPLEGIKTTNVAIRSRNDNVGKLGRWNYQSAFVVEVDG